MGVKITSPVKTIFGSFHNQKSGIFFYSGNLEIEFSFTDLNKRHLQSSTEAEAISVNFNFTSLQCTKRIPRSRAAAPVLVPERIFH